MTNYFVFLCGADIASNIPSFFERSTKYEDLFGEGQDVKAPIPSTPVSQLLSPSINQKRAPSGSKKRESIVDPPSSSELRSSKLSKLVAACDSSSSGASPNIQLFFRMMADQLPEAEIMEWDRMRLMEASQAKLLASAQSFFLDLKFNRQVVETARLEEGLKTELKHVRSTLATVTEERDNLHKAHSQFQSSEAKMIEDRRKEGVLGCSLEEEVESLAKQVKELQLQVDTLQAAAEATKETQVPREKAIFEAGVASGVKDCVKSACKFFLENDLAKLGPNAMIVLEEAKAEEVASGDSGNPVGNSKRPSEGELERKPEEKGALEAKDTPLEKPPVVAPVGAVMETLVADLITPDLEKASSHPEAQ